MSVTVKAGETRRINCGSCNAEFDLIWEPKCKPGSREQKNMGTTEAEQCPFCGDELREEADEE